MKDNNLSNLTSGTKRLIEDEFYFKSIFKKTEKIVCAVSYILAHNQKDMRETAQARDLEEWALSTLSFAGDTLMLSKEDAGDVIYKLINKLVVLESKLRVFHVIGGLGKDHFNVFMAEIDTVLRAIRNVNATAGSELIPKLFWEETPKAVRRKPSVTRRLVDQVSISPRLQVPSSDRRSQIKAVLIAQQNAAIKDIPHTVKDCSEKTIQRELNSMIDEGLIERKGERRWSTYSYIGQ